MKRLSVVATAILVVATSLSLGSWPRSSSTSFTEWSQAAASPLATVEPGSGYDDLRALRAVVGDASVVCLGHSRNDASEQLRLKHRFIEFLVEQMGFSVIVLEESLVHISGINEYIQSGEGTPEELLSRLSNWRVWDTREMLDVIEWMREYNAAPGHPRKVSIYGMDVAGAGLGLQTVLEYLAIVDPSYAAGLRARPLGFGLFDDGSWANTRERYGALDPEQLARLKAGHEDLIAHIEEHRTEYIARSSEDEYEWAHRQALIAQAADDIFSSPSREEGDLIRDIAMADNLLWIMEHEAPGERVVVLAGNAHIARQAFRMPDDLSGRLTDVGCYLAERLGDDLVTVGGVFHKGEYSKGPSRDARVFEPADTTYLGGTLAQLTYPAFLLDLRRAPSGTAAERWLDREHRFRCQDSDMLCVPSETFDAIYFVDHITRTTPNPASHARLVNAR